MPEKQYTVRVHHEAGQLWAEVTDLPGVFATGDTLDELREGLVEAIAMHFDTDLPTSSMSDTQVEERTLSLC